MSVEAMTALDPLELELEAVMSYLSRCWERHCDPPREQHTILTAEPFLQT